MSIQDWGAVGEVVGAIAVILTLIYLTTQIRQNTRQLRSQGHLGITDGYNEVLAQLLADPALFSTIVRGCQEWWKMVGETIVEDKLAQIINEKLASVEGTDSATTEAWSFFDPKNWRDPNEA